MRNEELKINSSIATQYIPSLFTSETSNGGF